MTCENCKRLEEENRWLYAEIGGEKAQQAIREWRELKSRLAEAQAEIQRLSNTPRQ